MKWTKPLLFLRTMRGYIYWLPKLNYRLRDQAAQIRNLLWERNNLKTWLARTYSKTMPDFIDATWLPISTFWTGHGGKLPKFVIVHTTETDLSAQPIAHRHELADESVHYIVDQDGKVFQCVSEEHSSCNSMELLPGSALFWSSAHLDAHINHRAFTIELLISSCKKPTNEQLAALYVLVKDIMTRHQISMQVANETGGVTGHFSLDPKHNPDCGKQIDYESLQQYLRTGQFVLPVEEEPVVEETPIEEEKPAEPEKPKRATKVKAADVE